MASPPPPPSYREVLARNPPGESNRSPPPQLHGSGLRQLGAGPDPDTMPPPANTNMAAEVSEPKAKVEKCILGFLNTNDEISDSDEFAESNGINRSDLESVIKSLSGFQFVNSKEIKKEQWLLTGEGKLYADEGSPEAKVFSAVPPEGILRADLEKKVGSQIFKIGSSQAIKNKWVETEKQLFSRKAENSKL